MGWREHVALPELGIQRLRAKVDTGARTSSLHADDISTVTVDGEEWADFTVPLDDDSSVPARAPVVDSRTVRSSSGQAEQRVVVATTLVLGGHEVAIELTLTGRDEMDYRMLVGREALRHRFIVDPARSWLATSSGPEQRAPGA